MSSSWKVMILFLSVMITLLLGLPVSKATADVEDYRINANRDADSFILGQNEPLQVNVTEGQTRTFSFDREVRRVISRNPTVALIRVVNGAIEARGVIPGRTGMHIIFNGDPKKDPKFKPLFMGLRVDHADGSLPGLPGPVALGSVSDDSVSNVAFWEDHVPGRKGCRMDIRYIYLNGGPFEGWATWGERVKNYTKNSLAWGMIPFFVFYNIPDGDENYDIDLAHVKNFYYMKGYYRNLNLFLRQAKKVMQGELYGVVLEPDFLGYMQKDSGKQPSEITTADGTLVDTVTKINQTIVKERFGGQNILFGWQLNLWADPVNYEPGVIRITDRDGWVAGREKIVQAATNTVNYATAAGVLSYGADFLSIDKYGLDAAGVTSPPYNPDNPSASVWFWNNDHWMNYLLYVNTLSQVSGKNIVLWQLPVGHINKSTAISVRTKKRFPDLADTTNKYEDSSTTFFLGDKFDASGSGATRLNYFSQNQALDPTLQVSGNLVTWGRHLEILPQYGVISAMFGAGIGISTRGISPTKMEPPFLPPDDEYLWIQKVQNYYLGLQQR